MADVRLIDGNALIDVNAWTTKQYSKEEFAAWIDGIKFMEEKIKHAPTIDPESLRPTGHWEESEYDGYLCSECGWGDEEGDPSMDYCPNCGAKMR